MLFHFLCCGFSFENRFVWRMRKSHRFQWLLLEIFSFCTLYIKKYIQFVGKNASVEKKSLKSPKTWWIELQSTAFENDLISIKLEWYRLRLEFVEWIKIIILSIDSVCSVWKMSKHRTFVHNEFPIEWTIECLFFLLCGARHRSQNVYWNVSEMNMHLYPFPSGLNKSDLFHALNCFCHYTADAEKFNCFSVC